MPQDQDPGVGDLTRISLAAFFRSNARCRWGSDLPSEVIERLLLIVSFGLSVAHRSTQHGTGNLFAMALNILC